MITRESLKVSLGHVAVALREPEEFGLRWHREGAPYPLTIWLALAGTAIFGTTTYGMTMGINAGMAMILQKSLLLTICAGLAWAIPLPALYILNSLAGSRLRASTTLLAALVTTSWGGLALVASIPINWLFSVAVPELAPELISPSPSAPTASSPFPSSPQPIVSLTPSTSKSKLTKSLLNRAPSPLRSKTTGSFIPSNWTLMVIVVPAIIV